MPAPSRLILASASPRRRQLLARLGVPFQVRPSGVAETPRPGEAPRRRAMRLAAEKAQDIAVRRRRPAWVLGADTIVVVDHEILEKPKGEADAARMLRRLSGRRHHVYTGICLTPAGLPGMQEMVGCGRTAVTFAPMTRPQVSWLLAAGEHMDKAGAYAVQGRAAAFISGLSGSASNVVGLPLDQVAGFLMKAGLIDAALRSHSR